MTSEQAERLLEVARDAVRIAESHSLQLKMAPRDVKANLNDLREIIRQVDTGA